MEQEEAEKILDKANKKPKASSKNKAGGSTTGIEEIVFWIFVIASLGVAGYAGFAGF